MAEVRTQQRGKPGVSQKPDAGRAGQGPVAASRARVTSKGQITIPKEIRERLGVRPGDSLEFQFEGDRLEVRPVRRKSISEFFGIFPPKPGVDPSIPWKEQRRIAWDWRAKRIVNGKDDDPDD